MERLLRRPSASLGYIVNQIANPDVQIFDVRADDEYFAERMRAKHGGSIPGAIHLDWTASQNAAGAFKSADELRAQFAKLGLHPDREVIPYCHGGYRVGACVLRAEARGLFKSSQLLGLVAANGAIATTCRSSINRRKK